MSGATYGDLTPGLLRWHSRRAGEDAARHGIGVVKAGRRIPLTEFYKQENDPMHITITLHEIANGVLASVNDGCGGSVEDNTSFFPDFDTAAKALPSLASAAQTAHLAEIEAAKQRVDDRRTWDKRAWDQGGSVSVGTSDTQLQNAGEPAGGIMPEVEAAQAARTEPPEIGAKLPEEAAVEAMPLGSGYVEDMPLAQTIEDDETEQAVRQYEDTFVRSEPVMRVGEPDYGDEQPAAD